MRSQCSLTRGKRTAIRLKLVQDRQLNRHVAPCFWVVHLLSEHYTRKALETMEVLLHTLLEPMPHRHIGNTRPNRYGTTVTTQWSRRAVDCYFFRTQSKTKDPLLHHHRHSRVSALALIKAMMETENTSRFPRAHAFLLGLQLSQLDNLFRITRRGTVYIAA